MDTQVEPVGLELEHPPAPAGSSAAADRPRPPRAARTTTPPRAAGLVLLALVAVALTVASVVALQRNLTRRFPAADWWGGTWVFSTSLWLSIGLGQLGGLLLWWRAPRNPTGRWLWLAGLSLGLWSIGLYLPIPGASVLVLGVYAFRPALAMAVLGWPSGRPTATHRRWIAGWALVVLALGLLVGLFRADETPIGWPDDLLAPFAVEQVATMVAPVVWWLTLAGPAALFAIILVRRRRSASPAVRRLIDPVVAVGVLIAASDLSTVVLGTLVGELLFDPVVGRETVVGVVNLTVNYGQVGLAAIGLLIAAHRRRRAVGVGDDRLVIDLRSSTADLDATQLVRRTLANPAADVAHGSAASPGEGDDQGQPGGTSTTTTETPIHDARGHAIAVVRTPDRDRVPASRLGLAGAGVVALAANEQAAADARARERELVAVQHRLLELTDADRRRLERDLHDGAQQRLVGAVLTARLAARSAGESARAEVVSAVRAAHDEIEHRVLERQLVVLRDGLRTGLATLVASSAIPTRLTGWGDVGGDDPVARHAWFIASEALANVVKHARATRATVELGVDEGALHLVVDDDGRGGVTTVPDAIARRAADAGGSATVGASPAGGTRLQVLLPRRTS